MLLARATARTAATSLGAQVSLPGRASSVVALPAASRAAPAPNRSTMSPQWQKLSQQWGGVQQGAQMLGPAQRQQLAQQWQSVQAQHASLQQGWAQLSQQQAYEEEQRQLLAAQAVLQQAMRDLEDARARQNAEIKPGVWRLTANNPEAQAFSMVGGAAYFVELLPDGSFRGRFDMSMLGGTAQAQVSGTWGYDYSQRIFDLVGMAGSPQLGGMLAGLGPQPQMMPTAFQMRFFVQPGPGPAYAAIFADDRRQWLIQRVG